MSPVAIYPFNTLCEPAVGRESVVREFPAVEGTCFKNPETFQEAKMFLGGKGHL